MTMERKQIYLDPGSGQRLKKMAAQRGVSEAFLIREAVNEYLAKAQTGNGEDARADEGLLRLVGMYRGEIPLDAAVEHDRYLYGKGRSK